MSPSSRAPSRNYKILHASSSRRHRSFVNGRFRVRRVFIALSVIAATATVVAVLFQSSDTPSSADPPAPSQPVTITSPSTIPLSDQQIQAAADDLLAAIDPSRAENAYFSPFARDHLTWMGEEVRAGRLTVGFFLDPASAGLPADVLMAATLLEQQPTILIAKRRFAEFLHEGGHVASPFTPQQQNDFAIAVIHEVVHLRASPTTARDPQTFAREELQTWQTVSLQVVRPLRSQRRPVHRRFAAVDDALRGCGDELPCPPLAQLIRLTP